MCSVVNKSAISDGHDVCHPGVHHRRLLIPRMEAQGIHAVSETIDASVAASFTCPPIPLS